MTDAFAATVRIDSLERRLLWAVDLAPLLDVDPQFVSPTSIFANRYQLDLRIQNLGNTAVDASQHDFFASVWLTRDTIIGNADDDEFIAFPNEVVDGGQIAPGGVREADFVAAFVDESQAAGSYYVAVVLDPNNQVAELNESNNTIFTAEPVITVTTDTVGPGELVHGTPGNDRILVQSMNGGIFISVNGAAANFRPAQSGDNYILIDGAEGDDKIFVEQQISTRVLITGSGGNDTIVGGSGNDGISGANGKDKINGGPGDDHLVGGAGKDFLNGGAGNDTCSGNGGNDRLVDLEGNDYLLGGAGNDFFHARDFSHLDSISGNAGFDTAFLDTGDGRASIEELLAELA